MRTELQLLRKALEQLLREVGAAPEQRQARRLRESVRGDALSSVAPHVLFLTPRSWASHVQWEAVIGQKLKLRGANVSFLTCGGGLEICDRVNVFEGPPMPCRTCASYVDTSLSAHGFFHEPLLGPDSDLSPEWRELDTLGAAELLEVEVDGVPLGRLVDVPVKWFLLSTDEGSDPLALLTRRRFLRAGRAVIPGLTRALDRIQPDVVVALNGLFFFEAIMRHLCLERGIDVVTYERGFIHNTLFFRRGLPAVSYDIGHLWSRWKSEPLTIEQEQRLDAQLADRRQGRSVFMPFSGHVQLSATRRLRTRSVLFTNVTWDSAVIGRELQFKSIQHWLDTCVEFFLDHPEHELVIRIHPAEVKLPGKQTREPIRDYLATRFSSLPSNIVVVGADDPVDSYALMESADIGLVYTSTTGLEMALMRKPVIVAAATHYRGKGFTVDVEGPTDFMSSLEGLLSDPASNAVDIESARRYAYTFFFRALVPSSFVSEPLPGLARLEVHSATDLHSEPLERICDGILKGEDFSIEA